MIRATEDRQANSGTSRPTRPRQCPAELCPAEWGGKPALLAAGLLLALGLAGCTGTSTGSNTKVPDTEQPGAAQHGAAQSGMAQSEAPQSGMAGPGATPSTAGAATADMKQRMTDTLGRLAAGTPKPATAQVTDALTGAGVAPAVLEVSASRTPTGLEADAVEAAVLEGTDCVIGQIRDGSVAVTVLPVLASGKCFVGTAG